MKGWLPEDKDAAILDVGCGRGEFLRFLHLEGYVNCEGIDLAEEQVEQSKRWNLPVRCEDALDYLKTRTCRYALITAFDFLEHLTRSEALEFLSRSREALRSGSLIMKTPNVAAPRGTHYFAGDLTHEQAYSPASLSQILRATGFDNVEFRETRPVPHSVASTIRSILWRFVRAAHVLQDRIETGGQLPVYTRNVIVRAVPIER
ncbi:MAG: class I SAM-dependent methyltransferase [Planctomycetes bacterium]|nr:class I SAM-dependent methyltransferase [Planctomycetota bacterium]